MTVKNVKYSFYDSKYQLGPFVEFEAELEVPSFEYDDVVEVLKKKFPKLSGIKVMSFKRV
jgi:hypothetical protein